MERETAFTQLLSEIYRKDFRRLFATLVRTLGDFDIAEDMLQEAFMAASQQWPREGVPAKPHAWLVQVAKHKALDRFRRERRFDPLEDAHLDSAAVLYEPDYADEGIEDDRLRLVFTCCHPALERQVQIALTLREVCGLATEAIARAFLVQPTTMAQRLVRGKAKIRTAGIPYVVPDAVELPERLDMVLTVVYLVYNEGYRASSGPQLLLPEIAEEAIRLGRLLVELLPGGATLGLLALMLLNESRRSARTSPDGDLILLEQQDRSRWCRAYIDEGLECLAAALRCGPAGVYTLQAAIAAEHAVAASGGETGWNRIVGFYDLLLEQTGSPVVALNRAVAIAMQQGPEAGLVIIKSLFNTKVLINYHPLHVAHAELSRRAGDVAAARASYLTALQLVQQEPERRHLELRLASL